MNRILRRPMFRTGGSTEGITSGLQPRQGYKGTDNASDQRVLQDILPGMTIGQMRDLSKELSYTPQRKYGPDFWVDFGLNLASTPPAGNIVSTAAQAAKDPFSRYTTAKREDELSQYATESDMFKTILGAQADILAAREEGKGGPEWQKQWEIEQIPILMDEIATLSDIKERTEEQDLALKKAEAKLEKIKGTDPALEWFLGAGKDVGANKLFKKIKGDLLKEDNIAGGEKYQGNEENPQLIADTYVAFRKYLRELKADGGRVGYQMGGDVMPGAGPIKGSPNIMDKAITDTEVEDAYGVSVLDKAPEDTAGITYEELRARLPQEITDDIVRLIANSAEALEDFAMIQTEQDINIFNKKYGVNLVLPSEG